MPVQFGAQATRRAGAGETMKDHGTQAFNNILLATTMENCPDGILVVDATAHVLSFNRRFVEMWAIPPDLIAAGKDEALLQVVTPQMKDAQGFLVRVQHLYAHPDETGRDELETLDGRTIDRHSAVLRDPDEQYLGRVWFFRDISEHKAAEQEIAVLARSDVLTGLANRRTFLDRLNHAFAGARRTGKQFAVLYLDLDSFKAINDAFGHATGDALLLTVAGRLTKVVRETDLVARFDFGSDQSSIGHLWSSKVSRLKIAPQLIEAMLRDEFGYGPINSRARPPSRYRDHRGER